MLAMRLFPLALGIADVGGCSAEGEAGQVACSLCTSVRSVCPLLIMTPTQHKFIELMFAHIIWQRIKKGYLLELGLFEDADKNA